jgi:hypothetical protein
MGFGIGSSSLRLRSRRQNPEAGEAPPGKAPIADDKVAQIFNTNIWGGTNIAVGGKTVTQTIEIAVGDMRTLKAYLASIGIEHTDLAALEQAVKADPPLREGRPFGGRVAGWIGQMTAKAASGGWQVGLGAAGDLLASAMRAYYGLP